MKDTGIMRLLLIGFLTVLLAANSNANVEATSTDTPSTDTPSTDTPSTDTPSTDTPSTDTPSTDTATTDTPSADTPSTDTPIAGAATSTVEATTTTVAAAAAAITTTVATTTTTSLGMTTSSTISGGTTVMESTGTTMVPPTSSMTTVHIHNPGSVTGMSPTNHTLTNMTEIYCPSFACNHSDCYTMYMHHNTTSCGPDAYCQLIKEMDMYDVGCSTNCTHSCTNVSHTNCSVMCCNTTGCLNDTFASMMTATTVAAITTTTTTATTTTTTTTVKTTTTSPQTTAIDGNKCYKGTCTDTDCYTSFKTASLQICTTAEKHCQLKKETVDSKVQWTAGCTANCSAQTPCKTPTQSPCHLECCNATMTSCLWLNGTLNFPSSATRGPYVNTELITCLLCMFFITLML